MAGEPRSVPRVVGDLMQEVLFKGHVALQQRQEKPLIESEDIEGEECQEYHSKNRLFLAYRR